MRIAIASWNRRKAGGAEIYLSGIIAELHRAGHSISLLHEVDEQADREQITMPDGAEVWSVADIGARRALDELRDWRPDLIYLHGLHDTALEEAVIETAPTVFFAHAYHGTCISGSKAFKSPTVTPCNRRFGWQCLMHYYPNRCGGLSPVTMMKQYRIQSKRLKHLHNCKAIATNSEHIRTEYLKYNIESDRVHTVALPVRLHSEARVCNEPKAAKAEWSLLFLGRMDLLKGGQILLDALPQIAAYSDKPLRMIFAGDGPERQTWESKAAKISDENPALTIEFPGWLKRRELDAMLADCDLLTMPSLWPEPFGLVGPEAGLRGVPAVAFAVGGISDWLVDGVNGHLAYGDPPTACGLADAILKCLRSRDYHRQLRDGAVEMARRFSMESHLTKLLDVFEQAGSR